MRIKSNYDLVDIADEYMLIPLGDAAISFKGVITLNEAAGFLLKHMKTHKTKEELVSILMDEYVVDRVTAEADVQKLLNKLLDLGVIEE